MAADIQPSRFISASGEYRAGDRIVLGDGRASVVVNVEPGLVRPRLVLDDLPCVLVVLAHLSEPGSQGAPDPDRLR